MAHRAMSKAWQLYRFLVRHVWHSWPLVLVALGALLAIACLRLAGPSNINNYRIFAASWHHLVAQADLYAEYPQEYYDVYLYGPLFALLMAPLALLPTRVGVVLWVLLGNGVIVYAVRHLVPHLEASRRTVFLWVLLNELFIATLMQQYNLLVAGMLLLTFAFVERDQPIWAALMIVTGALTKVYGLLGLLLFPFVKRKGRFILFGLLWLVVLLLLPLVMVGPEYLLSQYQAWFTALTHKDCANMFSLMQNQGFVGLVRKSTGLSGYSDLWLIAPGAMLLLAPLLRIEEYGREAFRRLFFSSIALFIVLFSTGTETNTYIVGYLGIGLWWITCHEGHGFAWYDLALFIGAMIFSQTTSDLFPRTWRDQFLLPYSFKAFFPMLIWLRIQWLLWSKPGGTAEAASEFRGAITG